MGYPPGAVELPRADPALRAELATIELDPGGHLDELLALTERAAAGGSASCGQLCSTAWVIDASAVQVLLVRHRRLGWVAPGGHTEVGETVHDAAVRELREETGLELTPVVRHPMLLHPALFEAPDHPAHVHWNVGFVFVASVDARLTAEEGSPAQWWPVDALPDHRAADLATNLALITAWWTSAGSTDRRGADQ